MSLPGDSLADGFAPSTLLAPDSYERPSRLVDYERGGVALQDPSQGLNVRDWTADYVGGAVRCYPFGEPSEAETLFSAAGITELALSFDQNMRPVVAYMVGTSAYLWWYDPTPAAVVTTALPTGIRSPALTLDDKRDFATLIGSSDILLVYIRETGLYYRQQRERFLTERLLASGIAAEVDIRRVGMSVNLRLQVELTTAEPGDPEELTYSANPALALGDFLRNPVYGCGEEVDWNSVRAAADACDALVGDPAEARRTIGVTFNTAQNAADIAEALRAYAGCFLLPWPVPTIGGGMGVRLLPDGVQPAVAAYRHSEGSLASIQPLQLRDLANSPTVVEVIFTDRTATPWRDEPAIAELPGVGTTLPYRLSQVRMPGVQRYSQAKREAIERLNKLRLQDLATNVEVFDVGIQHDVADVIALAHPLGLFDKLFRLTAPPELIAPGRWRLQCLEYDPASYSDEVETQPTYTNSGLIIGSGGGGGAGAPGADGTSVAEITIFQRNGSATEPDTPTADATLTISTGALSGLTAPWSQTLPATGGRYRWASRTRATVTATATTTTIVPSDWSPAVILADDGDDGESTVELQLSTYSISLAADSDGVVGSYAGAVVTAAVLQGGIDITTGWTISRTNSADVTSTISGAVVTVTALSADTGFIDIVATPPGGSPFTVQTKRLVLSKARSAAAFVGVAVPMPPQYGSGVAAFGATASVNFEFNRDGTIGGVDGYGNWYIGGASTIGDGFWIRATVKSGQGPNGGSALDTWLQLSSTRSWSWTVTNALRAGSLDVAISNSSSGSPILTRCDIAADVQSYAGAIP